MKKIFVISTALIVVAFLSTAVVKAEDGNPWDRVWAAINNLQNQISNIQLIPGPEGPQGPAGGTARLFSSETVANEELAPSETEAWAWNVPSGKYMATARISYRILALPSGAGVLTCYLARSVGTSVAGIIDYGSAALSGNPDIAQDVAGEMTLTGPTDNSVASQVGVQCYNGANTSYVGSINVHLLEVSDFGSLSLIP